MTYGGVDRSAGFPAQGTPYVPPGWPTQGQAPRPGPDTGSYRRFLVAAIVGTGTMTLGNAAVNVMAIATARRAVFSTELALIALTAVAVLIIGGLAGYVTLSLWMTRTRSHLVALAHDVPEKWRIWGGWFIPIYSFWGPYRTMEVLARRAPVGAALNVWWWLWISNWLVSYVSNRARFDADTSAFVSAIDIPIFVGSWLALVLVMRRVTSSVEDEVLTRAVQPPLPSPYGWSRTTPDAASYPAPPAHERPQPYPAPPEFPKPDTSPPLPPRQF